MVQVKKTYALHRSYADLQTTDSYQWVVFARRFAEVFPSLKGRENFVANALRFQFRLDGLIGPTGYLLTDRDNEIGSSLVKMFFRLREMIPELQTYTHREIARFLIARNIILPREKVIQEDGVDKDPGIEAIYARCGHIEEGRSLLEVFDEIQTLANAVSVPGILTNPRLIGIAQNVRELSLAALSLVLEKGYVPALLNEIIMLQKYWKESLVKMRDHSQTLTGIEVNRTLRFVIKKAEVLLQVANRDGIFQSQDIVLPPELSFLTPAACRALLADLLQTPGVNYLSLWSAFAATEQNPVVSIRGKLHDLSMFAPCFLIPYMKQADVYCARSGRLLGMFYYGVRGPGTSVRKIKPGDLKPAERGERIIDVRGKKGQYMGGRDYSITRKAQHSKVTVGYIVAFDGYPNLLSEDHSFAGAFRAEFTLERNRQFLALTKLADGLEEIGVKARTGRCRIGSVEYRLRRTGGEEKLLRWIPHYAIPVQSLGLAMVFSQDGSYLGNFKIKEQDPGRETTCVEFEAVYRDVPKIRALLPDALNFVHFDSKTVINLWRGTDVSGLSFVLDRDREEVSIFREGEDKREDKKIASFPQKEGKDLGLLEVVRRAPQVLPERESHVSNRGGHFVRWGIDYNFNKPGIGFVVHNHPEEGALPYAESLDGSFRFVLEHEPGSEASAQNVSRLMVPFTGLFYRSKTIEHQARRTTIPYSYHKGGRFTARITDHLLAAFSAESIIDRVFDLSKITASGQVVDDVAEGIPEGLVGLTYDEIELPYFLMHANGVRVRSLRKSLLTLNELSALISFIKENGQEELVDLLRKTGRSAIYMLAGLASKNT